MNSKRFFLKTCPLLGCGIVVVLCSLSLSPVDFLEQLQQNFDRYTEKYPSVKINMIFNQPTYSPGDTIFFSAWYLTEELQAVKGNHVVTLDLLSNNGNTAKRILFKIQNGKTYNQMVLRKDLSPGDYILVAYTDWMKNFGNAWFYQKKIQVVTKKQVISRNRQDSQIDFAAEGGNFIESIANKVVVTGPPSTELTIRDQQKAEILKVSLDSTGLGSFVITPKANQKYLADWGVPVKSWPLPEASQDGLTVRMVQGDACDVTLSIPPNSKWTNAEIYAVVSSRGKILVKQKVAIKEDQPFHLQIPKHDRSDALHQLFVFDSKGLILAQRVFVPYAIENVKVTMQYPTEVKQREKIAFTVGVADGLGNSLESDFCVSVIQRGLFPKSHPLLSDFYLLDLPEAAERAEQVGGIHGASLNDFLITQKWRRINWDAVLKDKSPELLFPFQSEAKLRGQALSKTTGSPAPDSSVLISYLQNNNIGFEAYTHNGKFEIPFVFDFWGDDEIFCTLQKNKKNIDDSYDITLATDTVKLLNTWSSSEIAESSPYAEYALSKYLVAKSYSFFGGNQQKASLREQNPNAIMEEEFLGTDFSVKVSDYVVFPNMEELLREIIPFVQFRKRGSQYIVRMSYRLETTSRTYENDPLYVIDGVMSKNTTIFMDMKPADLVTIKIINNPNKLAQLSRLGENGIIFVETKKRDFFNSLIVQNLFPVIGLSRPHDFFKMNYSNINFPSRVPDLRSTLFWSPSLSTTRAGRADINFFASDDVGPMKILVQGLTKDGRPFATEHELKVVFKPTPK